MLREILEKLEEILRKLENPETDPDEAFELYAEGKRLLKEAWKIVDSKKRNVIDVFGDEE